MTTFKIDYLSARISIVIAHAGIANDQRTKRLYGDKSI